MLPGISLCMIVKNSVHHMPRCLGSIRDSVDQMVVVDTGSDDATKQVALELGAEVYDFQWVNDFSAARNYSLGLARHEWILILDSDHEAIFTAAQLREAVAEAERRQAETIYLWIVDVDDKGTRYSRYSQPQMWRNGRGVHYVNPIHEAATVSSKEIRTPLEILHYGYFGIAAAELEEKRRRNLTMLTAEYEQHPDDPRVGWELAREYASAKNFTRALPLSQHAVECWRQQHPAHPPEPLMQELLIQSLTETQHYDEAATEIAVARAELPLFPMFPMLEQRLLVIRKRWKESLAAFEQYAELVRRYQAGETLQRESVVFGIVDYPAVVKAAGQAAVLCGEYPLARRYFADAYEKDSQLAVDAVAEVASRMPPDELLTLLAELGERRPTPPLKQFILAVIPQIQPDQIVGLRRLMNLLRTWPEAEKK